MARYSDGQVERVKREVSLLRLVEAKGIELRKHGKDYLGHCPFHDDKTPSLVVSPDKNLWNCLGACGVGGSVIDWVMKVEGVSFRHAMELLGDGYETSPLAADSKLTKSATTPKLSCPVSGNADDQQVMREVIDYYHTTLKQSPEAIGYLKSRGLDHRELIDTFKIGFANRTLGLRLPFGNRVGGKAIREQLQRIGLYRDTGREHFNGSIVIPIFSGDSECVGMYGRKLLDNLRPGTPKHTYLPGAHRGVWNETGLHHTDEIILCEALIDAMTFWCAGFRHVTSSYGVNGFTDDILQVLVNNKIKRVLVAYDRDDAGNAAAEKLALQLSAEGMDVYRIVFPKGMDANEYALKVQPAQQSLALVIRKAELMQAAKKMNHAAPSLLVAPVVDEGTAAPVVEGKQQVMDDLQQLHEWLSDEAEDDAEEVDRDDEQDNKNKKTKSVSPEQSTPIDENAAPLHVDGVTDTAVVDVCATPVPSHTETVGTTITDNDVHLVLGDRNYRVRGLNLDGCQDQLKINLMVRRGEYFHTDKLDLYSHKQRQVFVNQAGVEVGVAEDTLKKDLGKLLLQLEVMQQEHQQQHKKTSVAQTLNEEQRREAMALLKDNRLLDRILSDFAQAGVVGEEANKLTGYLACVSRKLDKPLAVLIQSSSAAGKSSLMDAILALMPEEERVQYSAMTGQSLFYMGETNLKNKILAIAEEEGAHNASYALKLLQSEGVVTIASTGKDESTGDLVTKEYKVQGPVMLFLTTTAIDIDEELLNRCLVLSVNESREQTQAIHRAQRQKRTLAGLQSKLEREAIITLHCNAQRLLKPLHVVNPFADQLTFLDDKTRTRRDHEKYLTLIDSIALLHQHQRDIKTITAQDREIHYIEVTLDDIAQANTIAHDVLGRTLDELPPQTRKMLKALQQWVRNCCERDSIAQNHFRFSRKQLREQMGWTNDQVRVHLDRLTQLEYVLTHRGGRGQSFEYELLYDGQSESEVHLMGLLDVGALANTKNNTVKNITTIKSMGGSHPDNGVSLGGQWGGSGEYGKSPNTNNDKALHETNTENKKCTSSAVQENMSYINNRSSGNSALVALV